MQRILLGLLLLPLAHFALLVTLDTRAVLNPSPEVWESEVKALERRTSFSPVGLSPLVVIGGRQAILWRNLERSLFPLPVVNAGIGSANLDDLIYYFDRLVQPYAPGAVFYIPSPSDFIGRDNKSPEEFMLMLRGLQNYVARLDGAPHFYLTPLFKWPRYPEHWQTVEITNTMIAQWAKANPGVTLVDLRPMFQVANGKPVAGIFRSDGVNLNDWGYDLMSSIAQAQMEEDFPLFY